MTHRERNMALIVGTAIVLGGGYQGVNKLLIQKYKSVRTELANLEAEERQLDGIIRSRESLATRWLKYTARTFSFERAEAQGGFGKDLKEIAKRHGFGSPVFATSSGSRIGSKTKITTVAHRITVEGTYANGIAFLREIYGTPYLSQIKKLTVSPLGVQGRRGEVKLEFTVESPLLPRIDPKKIREVANASTMPRGGGGPQDAFRKQLRGDAYYEILAARNILRPYIPPPLNVVMIDNQDRKTVVLAIDFLWDGMINERLVETVAGQSTLPIKGRGSIVDVEGTYADGEAFGPKRFQFNGKRDWTFVVASHTPPPPPTVVDLAVNNADEQAVYVEVTIVDEDGQEISEPVMWFEPGVSDIREYMDVASVKVQAKYASGRYTGLQTFTPSAAKQTFQVVAEPVAIEQAADDPEIVVVRDDPPPDHRYTVTSLQTYSMDGRPIQEMVVSTRSERKYIRAGEEGAVDGGTLLAIVPALGGIVKMSDTGNYYIYPLGKRFTWRVRLAARKDDDLSGAIDAWTRR